jgi:hypothetical protein
MKVVQLSPINSSGERLPINSEWKLSNYHSCTLLQELSYIYNTMQVISSAWLVTLVLVKLLLGFSQADGGKALNFLWA